MAQWEGEKVEGVKLEGGNVESIQDGIKLGRKMIRTEDNWDGIKQGRNSGRNKTRTVNNGTE